MMSFEFTFSIGESVEMKDGRKGDIHAIEMLSPKLPELGFGIFVAPNMNEASDNIQRFVDTGLFCIRYGIKIETEKKISFFQEHEIVGGKCYPFGKGSVEYVRESFIREIQVSEEV